MFLIDTMVLSELRRRERDPGVVAWINSQRHEDCFLSVVSIGEIERGIARKRVGDPAFAALWRSSAADERGRGTALGPVIGLEHGLTVVTRNRKHFRPTGGSGAHVAG